MNISSKCKKMLGISVSLALTLSGICLGPTAQAAEPPPATTTPASSPIQDSEDPEGPSNDSDAIAAAAEEYISGDAATAAELADAASSYDAVPFTETKTGLTAATEDGGEVVVNMDGDISLSVPGLPEIGISAEGDADNTKIVDGVLVQTGIAPSTDLITRATENGVQLVAVLGDENAPSTVEFAIDLPDGAQLVEQPNGSFAVLAEIESEAVSEAEANRIASAADSIIGQDFDGELTDVQIDLLDAIPAPETYTTKATAQIGEIGVPWAVDANGELLDTHYEVTSNGITQVVETDDETAYPVTADPWFDFLPKPIQLLMKVVKMVVVSNTVFAMALGAWVRAKTTKSGGGCRTESSYSINVCWGGKLQWMTGGGGTTYGTTFLYKGTKDPTKEWPYSDSSKYKALLKHESAHMKQWKALGPTFAVHYVSAMGVSLYKTGTYACGNIWEMMAGFKDGGYKYC